jgi:hypothetical protein
MNTANNMLRKNAENRNKVALSGSKIGFGIGSRL